MSSSTWSVVEWRDTRTSKEPNDESTEAFSASTRAQGFDEVLERKWQPLMVLDTHRHPFALKALVVQGEMWLIVGDDERHLLPGDEFALERDVPHAERYGAEGATYLVARRNS